MSTASSSRSGGITRSRPELVTAAASPRPSYDDFSEPPSPARACASRSQLSSLTALPAGMPRRVPRKVKASKLVSDSKPVHKSFDLVGRRPYPSLTDPSSSITTTLAYTTSFVNGTVSPGYLGISFQLSSFPGYSSYTGLFDMYWMRQLEVWISPNAVTANPCSDIVSVIDVDDANTPTSYNLEIANQGALVLSGQAGHYHKWLPHMAVAVYSGTFTSYGNVKSAWIDSASPGVQHYGLKIAAGNPNTVSLTYNIEVRAVVSFAGAGVP